VEEKSSQDLHFYYFSGFEDRVIANTGLDGPHTILVLQDYY
jgi:hypothetical protein